LGTGDSATLDEPALEADEGTRENFISLEQSDSRLMESVNFSCNCSTKPSAKRSASSTIWTNLLAIKKMIFFTETDIAQTLEAIKLNVKIQPKKSTTQKIGGKWNRFTPLIAV
jgi:hypothetical protein